MSRRAQALPRPIRRQAAGAAAAPAARSDLARHRFVSLPRAYARPAGRRTQASIAASTIRSAAWCEATYSVFTLPLVGRVGAKRRGGGRAATRWPRLTTTPTPTPSPQGGGEQTEYAAPFCTGPRSALEECVCSRSVSRRGADAIAQAGHADLLGAMLAAEAAKQAARRTTS
jgi:hypothetical protein